MTKPIPLPVLKRRRGNPNWGQAWLPVPNLPTEFELQVKRLGLVKGQYVGSNELKRWCERNRNRLYVPECLLEACGMQDKLIFWRVA